VKRYASIGGADGFVKAGAHVWLLGNASACRVAGDTVITLPWAGATARPHRLATRDALWSIAAGRPPVRCLGPFLRPQPLDGPPLLLPELFRAWRDVAIWVAGDDRQRRIVRSDGRDDRVSLEILSLRPFDLAPLPEATLILVGDPAMLVRYVRGQHTDLRLPLGQTAEILRIEDDVLWIRSGDVTLRVRGREVETLPCSLVSAGDALAKEAGGVLRLHDHPLADHNALRGARHLFVDGRLVWAARDDGIVRLDAGRARLARAEGPSLSEVFRVFPSGAGLVVVVAEQEQVAINRYDGRWHAEPPVQGRVQDVAYTGRSLWIATDRAVYEGRAPRFSLKAVPGLASVDRVSADAERVVVRSGGRLFQQLTGREGIWAELVLPPGWSHTGVRSVAIVSGRIASLVGRGTEKEVAVWWEGAWRRLSLPSTPFMYDRNLWCKDGDLLARWTGAEALERWRLPIPMLGRCGSDDASPHAIWWQNGDEMFRGDVVTREVRRVVKAADASVETTLRDATGMYWLSAARGALAVPEAETQVVGQLIPQEPLPALATDME
jgi:hypothetical protein